ncbi:MAG: hypothetical protein H0Z33_09190 [Bacillaceae bacterium]|nr:hypothetical protein [Bacillaceae bacterium]
METQELYRPTLREKGVQKTQSYEIGYLVYVAFFGGIIAITVLGARNARWLGVNKSWINALITAGVILLAAKFIAVSALLGLDLGRDINQYIKLGSRGAAIFLFLAYYYLMKYKYKEFLAMGGEVNSLKGDGIFWVAIAIFVEVILLSLAGAVSHVWSNL